jgi:hypothetical protein
MGLGAAAFGVLVVHTGYPAAFALTAAALPVALAVAGRHQGWVWGRNKGWVWGREKGWVWGRNKGMPVGVTEARTTSRSA